MVLLRDDMAGLVLMRERTLSDDIGSDVRELEAVAFSFMGLLRFHAVADGFCAVGEVMPRNKSCNELDNSSSVCVSSSMLIETMY